MSDNLQSQAPAPLQVNGQYIKDLSFEVPNAPHVLAELAGSPPEVSLRVDIHVEPLHENTYEVVLHLAIEAKAKEKTAFILELSYGGAFTVYVPEEHLQPFLLIECPRLLFPFVRSIVSEVTMNGGFAPMVLPPIDFVTLFRNRMEQLAKEQSQAGSA
jgi:preprotein translocase subunit SecB